jgi:hypothetical protein
MSEPIRYNIKPGEEGYQIVVSLGGDWVAWQDYARLKAEVERLTKAGDGVFEDFMEYVEDQEPAHMRFLQCQADWDAAKEGKTK